MAGQDNTITLRAFHRRSPQEACWRSGDGEIYVCDMLLQNYMPVDPRAKYLHVTAHLKRPKGDQSNVLVVNILEDLDYGSVNVYLLEGPRNVRVDRLPLLDGAKRWLLYRRGGKGALYLSFEWSVNKEGD